MVHVLISGRLIYRKGVELLIDSVSQLNTESPYIIDIYGDGEQRHMLEKKVKL